MAEKRMHIELCAPEHAPVSYEADEIILPGAAGILTILPGHTSLLTTLGKGVIAAYDTENEARYFAIHEGFAEILNDRILILAETMELAENIDEARAEAAFERATKRLHKPSDDIDIARAEAALARSLARLQARAGHEF